MTHQPLTILLLAAGQSQRMGGADKLMEEIDGTALLTRMVREAQGSGHSCLVALPGPNHPRASLIDGATTVFVPDAVEGMAASIRQGVAALAETCQGVMILPADMPELTRADLSKVAETWLAQPDHIALGTAANGTPGHPVIFPRRCFQALSKLIGDQGARAVIRTDPQPITRVALPHRHALTDLDTPEAWIAWRAAQRADR